MDGISSRVTPVAGERRRSPRLPVGVPVAITDGRNRCAGATVDASEDGLLVRVDGSLGFLPTEVTVSLVLPSAGRHDVEARVVRRSLGADGAILLALRTADGTRPRPGPGGRPARPPAEAGEPRRRAARAPASRRPRGLIRRELRALAAHAYELALLEPGARAPRGLAAWAGRLADELGAPPPPAGTARELLTGLAALARECAEDPEGSAA